MAFTATISSKGQVVIPAKLRKRFGMKEGRKVVFSVEKNKLVISSADWDAIEALYGKYAGLPLEEDLMEEKRLEREREDRKLEMV
jgi:AbrB family looped-hinge helix DNA binding protein